MTRKKPQEPIEVGSVFAFQLPNKLFTACRVLRKKKMDGEQFVLAVCSPFISKDRPVVITEEMNRILRPNYHGIREEPAMYWISEPIRKEFVLLGTTAPSLEEKRFDTDSYGGWLNFQFDALTQWRWDHEREKLLQDEAEEERAMSDKQDAVQAAHEAELKSMTLEKLAKYRFFPDWDDYPSAKVINAARRLMKETVAQLADLGKPASKSKKMASIKSCVESFNALNTKYDEFIDTDIREDILVEIDRLTRASGLGEMTEQLDAWRDW